MNDSTNQPLLRWAGSKRSILPALRASAPHQFERYFEPFCGSACFYLSLSPSSAVLSDINSDLIHAYRTLRRSCRRVYETATRYPRTEKFYYKLRALDTAVMAPIDRAARFFYLNRFCFNGLYRTNRIGHFNVPFGRNTGDFPQLHVYENFARSLRRVELRNEDFEDALRDVAPHDFVYLDPPYFSPRPTYGEYGYGTFRAEDLGRLLAVVERLSQIGAYVLISYGGIDLTTVSNHLRGRSYRVHRHVAGAVRSRRDATDCLLSNYG
jgi:DNA adenine methylase